MTGSWLYPYIAPWLSTQWKWRRQVNAGHVATTEVPRAHHATSGGQSAWPVTDQSLDSGVGRGSMQHDRASTPWTRRTAINESRRQCRDFMHHDPLHIISVIVLIRSIVWDVVVARTCDHLKRYGGLSIKSSVPAYIQRMRNLLLIRTKVCL